MDLQDIYGAQPLIFSVPITNLRRILACFIVSHPHYLSANRPVSVLCPILLHSISFLWNHTITRKYIIFFFVNTISTCFERALQRSLKGRLHCPYFVSKLSSYFRTLLQSYFGFTFAYMHVIRLEGKAPDLQSKSNSRPC